MKAVRVLVAGRVQKVWYRGWLRETAERRGVRGWVRNRRDGRVEAVLAGPEAAVGAVLDACRSGPPAARVDEVAVSDAEPPESDGFVIRPTG